jgi:hypothetical protein
MRAVLIRSVHFGIWRRLAWIDWSVNLDDQKIHQGL